MARIPRRKHLLILLGLPMVFVGALALVPIIRQPYLPPNAGPSLSFEASVAEIRREIAATPDTVLEQGRTILLDHGRPTEHVFVLLHGLSNCPTQFLEFGKLLYAHGHTVLIPRLPYHGEKDVLTEDWARLSGKDMLDTANHSVDLARSLGSKVTAAGLSINGTACAWLAQNRPDLHRSVLMAPFLAPAGLPVWAARPVERILLRLPNVFFWWNPAKKANLPRPPWTYPRFPTHVIGETVRLGSDVFEQAQAKAAVCPSILVITTASDLAASYAFTSRLTAAWEAKRSLGISTYQFPTEAKVPHDFIDPHQPDQKVALVYPRLIDLLEK